MNEITLFKPNELVAAIDQLEVSRTAKHLCNYFLQYAQTALLNPDQQNNSKYGNTFEIYVSELNAEAQIGLRDYKLIEKSLKALMQPVTIRDRDNPRNFTMLVPIYMVAIDFSKGVYRFSLAPEVIDILKKYKFFTKLDLHEFNFLESKHSHVLYEWLKRWETSPQMPELPIDELRRITHTANKKSYDNFTDVKRFILDVAVTEINEKTPYQVSYDAIKTRSKTRNKVTAIQFHFTKKEIKIETKNKLDNPVISMPSGYEKLRKVCGRYMNKEFYFKATYIYMPETLEQFAIDCIVSNYHPNITKFFEWLNERCSMNQKGYYKQKHIYSEKFFRDVFTTSEEDPASIVHTEDGREMWLGGTIETVHEEYVTKAMEFYGKLPYNDYRHYLSGIWNEFQKEFNVYADNVFEQ